MRSIYCLLIGTLLLSSDIYAQEAINKGLSAINRQGVEAHLSFLADDIIEGREAGQRGGLLAAGYLKTVLSGLGILPFGDNYYQPFEAYSRDRQKKTPFRVHPDSIARYKQENAYRKLNLKNVIGYIEGQIKDEYVIIGAHYDHLGIDETLSGDRIYNGADDNASGIAAVLQVARACVAADTKPLRSIIFAFWDAEELGCLGSEYFVANFVPLMAIKGYINLDMLGREGTLPIFPARKEKQEIIPHAFFFFYAEELAQYKEKLIEDISAHELGITATPRLLSAKARGSDNASFSGKNIPVWWFFTGIHPEYHSPADEIEKIDFNKLTDLTKIIYVSLWKLANDQ